MSENKTNKDSSNKQTDPNKPKIQSYWIYIAIAVVFLGMQFINFNQTVEQIGQVELEELINKKSVSKIIIVNKEKAEIEVVNPAFPISN